MYFLYYCLKNCIFASNNPENLNRMKNIIVILAMSLIHFAYSQPEAEWKLKVSNEIFNLFKSHEKVEYLVQLKGNADISMSKDFKSKKQKSQYVYNQLKSYAEISQKDLIEFCIKNKIKYKSFFVVNAMLINSDYGTMRVIAKFPSVKYIEANPSYKVPEIRNNVFSQNRSPNAVEWGVEKINADDVWNMGYTGTGVVIGGQDTGYRWTHEALQSKYRGWDGNSADHNYNWHDAIHSIDTHNTGDNPCGLSIKVPCDDNGHGTHTMGTMVGSAGNNDIGVAPDAKWMGCRNMERGWGKPSTYIECFEWFLAPTDTNDLNPDPTMAPDVINNSWYCPADEGCDASNYSTMETAINNLRDAGIVVVVSAGNSGPNCSTINTPPNFFSSSFDVGATNSMDTIANFSSRGPTSGYGSSILKPNVSAPGVNVRSSTFDSDNSYGNKSGTSMAGPHVAGAVALLIDAFPSFKGDPDTIEHVLQNSAIYLDTDQSCGGVDGTEVPNNTYGYGRIDVLAAINYVNSLPVKIISFDADIMQNNSVRIYWEVESRSLESIEIHRSNDGLIWHRIAASFNNTSSFIDKSPNGGFNYYRLKIIDKGDFISFSKILFVEIDSDFYIENYPTLLRSGQYLNFMVKGLKNKEILIKIYNSIGSLVFNKEVIISNDYQKIMFPFNSISKGTFFINIYDKKTKQSLKTLKFHLID